MGNFQPQARGFYLGNPTSGYGMIRLPAPKASYSSPRDQREVEHALASGGTTVTRRLNARGRWELAWPPLTPAQHAVLYGFYTRAYGPGPWVFIDPADTNRLTLDASLCGGRLGTIPEWSVPAGQTLATDATVTPQAYPGGVMRWTGATTGSVLAQGTQGAGQGEPITTSAAPYLPAEAYTVSFYVRAYSTSAAVTAQVSGRNAAATVHIDIPGPETTIDSTGWVQVVATAPPGALAGAQYVMPTLLASGMLRAAIGYISPTGRSASSEAAVPGIAGGPPLLICCPQLELATAASAWLPGAGTPRVVASGPLARNVGTVWQLEPTLILQEI